MTGSASEKIISPASRAFWDRSFAGRRAQFEELRQRSPIEFHTETAGPGFWSVVGYDDVVAVSRNPEVFSSANGFTIDDVPVEILEFAMSMIAMDDPRHRRLRGIVQSAFTAASVRGIAERVRGYAAQIAADLPRDAVFDFVPDVATRLPVQVICELIGIPENDRPMIPRSRLDTVASDIRAAGGQAETALLDVLDTDAVERHADAVAARAGGIDVALTAIGIAHVQGTPLADLSLADYELPITTYARANFITAKAAARHMAARGSGVILTLSTPGARLPGPGYLGNCVASAAVEALSRHLAGELGARGIRVVCIRPHAIPEAAALGSHTREVFAPMAERAGLTIEQMLAGAASGTLLKRLPTLDQVANTAVFLASKHAGAITGTVANLSAGFLVD